jgi:hypothetical protein
MTTSKPENKSDNTYGDYWSGKKPYLVHDFRQMMKRKTQEEYFFHELTDEPMSELYKPWWQDDEVIPGMGWEYMGPPVEGPPYFEPPGGIIPGGECGFACNPSMLDCEGGCTTVVCICGVPPLNVVVLEDPTGGLISAIPIASTMVKVCLQDNPGDIDDKYPKALIGIQDGKGRIQKVQVSLVDCKDCCDSFTFTGDATVNPNATWSGTLSPGCEYATVSVASNSGCTLTGLSRLR